MDKWYEEPVRFERPPGSSGRGSVVIDRGDAAEQTLVHEVYKVALEAYERTVRGECTGLAEFEKVKDEYDKKLEEGLSGTFVKHNEEEDPGDKLTQQDEDAGAISTLQADVENLLSHPTKMTGGSAFSRVTLFKYKVLMASVDKDDSSRTWKAVEELESVLDGQEGQQESLLDEGKDRIKKAESMEEMKRQWGRWREAERVGSMMGALRARALREYLEGEKGGAAA
jgi:hypothetical protein